MSEQLRRVADGARKQWLDLVVRRRRWLVAALVGLAVASGLQAVAPRPAPTVRAWVAARALPGGRPLSESDVRLVSLPVATAPAGLLPPIRSPAGRVLAAPVDRGEPLTGRRLLGKDLLDAVAPGAAAVAVHVADGAQLAGLVHPGDTVDVFAAQASPTGGTEGIGDRVATALPVLAVPGTDPTGSGVVVVAARPEAAARLATAAANSVLSVAVVSELRAAASAR